MHWHRLLLSLIALASFVTLPRDAHAYVREVTTSGVPVAWRTPCVTMRIFLGSTPAVLTPDAFLAASTQAAAAWSYPTLACTDIRLSTIAEADATADIGNDATNVIVFWQDAQCRAPQPGADAGAPQPDCLPSSALALTSIFKNAKTGEILDTDIEFNAVDYTWGDLVGHPEWKTSTTADFQNALTHELGHALGLDHNCFTKSDGQPRLNDNTGAPEVDCYNPTPSAVVTEATMYPSVVLSDTMRRELSADDQQGICEIYPHLHEACPAIPAGGGCSVLLPAAGVRTTKTGMLWTGAGVMIVALARLRRRLKV